jgi:UDPglucose 6-dehydrogenase
MAQIAIVGLGYVGLTTALAFSHLGHKVMGYDIDDVRVKGLNLGKSPIFEKDIEELLSASLNSGAVKFTTHAQEAVGDAEFIFICVPTPQRDDGSADLSFVMSAAAQICPLMRQESVFITKSTVPVGTGGRIVAQIGDLNLHVASNPEFLREGTAIADFLKPDRVVVGAANEAIANRILALYQKIDAPKLAVSMESAELIKHASNTFLAMKLAFINDIAFLCEQVDADIEEVAKGIGLDSRIGSKFLKAGPGWGGSCFPKDTKALETIARSYGVEMPLITAAIESNFQAHNRVVARVQELTGGNVKGKTIAAWGLAFKANTDDTRSSPAVAIISALIALGATVRAYDPVARVLPAEDLIQVDSPIAAAEGADVLVLLTEWPEFEAINPKAVTKVMRGKVALDTRRTLDLKTWNEAMEKFEYLGGSSLANT